MPLKDITLQKITNLKLKHPDKVPVVIKYKMDDKYYKFLVGQELSLAQFMNIFRKRMSIAQEESLYFFDQSKNTLLPTSHTMSMLHNQYKNENDVLELVCTKENVFGSF